MKTLIEVDEKEYQQLLIDNKALTERNEQLKVCILEYSLRLGKILDDVMREMLR